MQMLFDTSKTKKVIMADARCQCDVRGTVNDASPVEDNEEVDDSESSNSTVPLFECNVQICEHRRVRTVSESLDLCVESSKNGHKHHQQTSSFYKELRQRDNEMDTDMDATAMGKSGQLRKRSRRRFKPKPEVFVIFADLDGTFTPMDLKGFEDFVEVVDEIQSKTGAKVKFVPVSGRPAGYVLRVLHECRDILSGAGIHNVCDYGAAEQGAVIVDSSRSYDSRYLGYFQNKRLKAEIAEILAANQYAKIVSDEPDKLYTCSIHIKNEAKADMSDQQQKEVYLSIRNDIWDVFGETALNISMSHNCMEVMHKEISKSYAMNLLLTKYQRYYNITGLCMCGDAENDKIALNYVSRLAEIPGIQAHVFTPANAQKAISTSVLEQWKNRNPSTSSHRIRKAPKNLFLGISWLIRDELQAGTLLGPGLSQWIRSYDDLDIPSQKNSRQMANGDLSLPIKFTLE